MSEISVLVVDDDKNIRDLLDYNLKQIGYDTIIVENVHKAKEAIDLTIPDLIIADVMMPDIDGIEFRKYVKSISQLQFTPFVFLTVKNSEKDIVEGFGLDVDDYITKPFNMTLFVARLKSLVKQYQRYRKLYRYDALTGLLNRYAFEEKFDWELRRLNRYGGILSLLALDIDEFKLINDRYGHQKGDAVLKTLGDIVKLSFRDCDFAGRPGGDEMIVAMPETSKEGAYLASERFRKRVEKVTNVNSVRFTISGGIAIFPGDGRNSKTLLKKADNKLYEAKHNGRNQIK
jgi:diguanylate cyclase (GGDEF)-like protein